MLALIPAIIAATAGAMDAVTAPPGGDAPTDPEGSNGTSPNTPITVTGRVGYAAARAADVRLQNTGVMPTTAQRLLYKARRHKDMPEPVVPRVYTPPPHGANKRDLMPFVHACNDATGMDKAGFILACLYTMETGAGNVDYDKVACYNFNVGNFKGNGRAHGPVFFLVDRLNSLDVYPSYPNLNDGINAWIALLRNGNYNRAGMKGASASLRDGDIVEFNKALGVGGYAASYRNYTLLKSIYQGHVRRGVLTNGLGL